MTENQQKPTLSLNSAVTVKRKGDKRRMGGAKKGAFGRNDSRNDGRKPAPRDKGRRNDRDNQKPRQKTNLTHVQGLPSNRIAAFEVAQLVLLQDHYLDKALAENERLKSLYPSDRQFVRMMVTSLLRHHKQLEELLDDYVSRRPPPQAFLVLMMGAVQILLMRTPQHAALSTTVDLMRAAGFDHMTGMANAILRKLTNTEIDLNKPGGLARNIAPEMLKSWQQAYGHERTSDFIPYLFSPPQIDLSFANPDKAKEEAQKREGTILHPTTIRVPLDGDITKWDGFAEGDWWIQDMAATIPAHLLGDITGKTVIDMCAAPGGKTAQLIAKGAAVTAIEIDPKRARRLSENLERLKMSCVIEATDALSYEPQDKIDAILLDAPCSATGTIRKRPDVMRKDISAELKVLPKQQEALARRAISWLNRDGVLVFATCSLQIEEGEKIIEKLISGPRAVAKILPITAQEACGFEKGITPEGYLRLLPDALSEKGGNDGFFIARLARL